jgi:hypothetical protein
MQYLDASEYVPFGLSDETGDDLVTAASALIDSFCRRPSLGITQYVERLRFARHHSVQLSNTPLASADGIASPLVLVRARTCMRRRFDDNLFPFMNEDALAFLTSDQWIAIDVSTIDIATDGVLHFLPNFLGAAYRETEVTYTAGFTTVPTPVQVACAQIVRNAQAMPALNVRRQTMDSMQMEYFGNTLLDADVQRLLLPYQSQRMG